MSGTCPQNGGPGLKLARNLVLLESALWFSFQPPYLPVIVQQVHFYTMDENEKDTIIAVFPVDVWRYEGIAYYAYP